MSHGMSASPPTMAGTRVTVAATGDVTTPEIQWNYKDLWDKSFGQ